MTRKFIILTNAELTVVLTREVMSRHGLEFRPGQELLTQVMQTYRMQDGKATNEVLQTRVEVSYDEEIA